MNRKLVGIILICALAVSIITIIVFVGPVDVSLPKKESEFEGWNRSGPFAINKIEYKIGENIFIIAEGLTTDDVGSMIFVLPNGTTKYITIPFDGSIRSEFNQYFEPSISKSRKICHVGDIIGEWTVIFDGVQYQPLKFRIINETLPRETGTFERVC